MQIEHAAIWTRDLERLRSFYETVFGAQAGAEYRNPATGFHSRFLTFDGGARLEIMSAPDVLPPAAGAAARLSGYAHLAFALGSREAVDRMAAGLRAAGVPVLDGPRTTGDGYYEAVFLDPDGNRVEITI